MILKVADLKISMNSGGQKNKSMKMRGIKSLSFFGVLSRCPEIFGILGDIDKKVR